MWCRRQVKHWLCDYHAGELRRACPATCGIVSFHAEADELSFFRWIDGIKAVRRWWYETDCLCLNVTTRPSQKDLRDLLGLFQRYEMDMRLLAPLRSATSATWFINPKQPWHQNIFAR